MEEPPIIQTIPEERSNAEEQCEPSTSGVQMQKTRKRQSRIDDWNDNHNKRQKNSGQAYRGARSKTQYAAKVIGPTCSCRKKCGDKFTQEKRQTIFDNFYRLKDHELQWQYIARHTEALPVKRLYVERKLNRVQTIIYDFPLDGTKVQVCKTFFLNTLQISERVVYTALEKINKDESLIDKRGTHKNRPHQMKDSTKKSIITHIRMFPAVESHYVRKDSKREYLSEGLNISKMYRLYKIWFSNQDDTTPADMASKRQYEKIFNTNFNYSFFRPKKDLCGTCALYEQADEMKKIELEDKYKAHLKRKERVRQIKEEEKDLADESTTTIAIFDLEKVLSVPQCEIGIFHYKRKYPIYNFTVYNSLKKQGHCYVWHLLIAKRGAIEIGSCLLKFIQQESERGIKNISFYSDGCAGQNKNRYIFAMYLYAVKVFGLEKITHHFFETGHSQNEGDSMHSCIERAMKNKRLFTPDQVYSVIMNAKVSGKSFAVNEMEQKDFFDIKKLITEKNWLKDTEGDKIAWTKVMQIEVCQTKPHI